MNTIEVMKRIIEEVGRKEFTHHDIIKWTNTNCPYGVLRQLKKYYEIDYEDVVANNTYNLSGTELIITKRFRRYKVKGRKERDVQKSCIR